MRQLILGLGLLAVFGLVGCSDDGSDSSKSTSKPVDSVHPDIVLDVFEVDRYSDDTDDDGLPDDWEITYSGSFFSPTLSDTDEDGILDADEDDDLDGLLASEEMELGSSPLTSDSDSDYLDDSEEIAQGTEISNPDSDGDGILDGLELQMGLNPLNADTDGDGVSDADDSIQVRLTNKFGGSVQFESTPSNFDAVSLTVYEEADSNSVRFNNELQLQVADGVLSETQSITVSFPLGDVPADDAGLNFYHPNYGWIEIPASIERSIDYANGLIFITLTLQEMNQLLGAETIVSSASNKVSAQANIGALIAGFSIRFAVENATAAAEKLAEFFDVASVTPAITARFTTASSPGGSGVSWSSQDSSHLAPMEFIPGDGIAVDEGNGIELDLSFDQGLPNNYTITVYTDSSTAPGTLFYQEDRTFTINYSYLYTTSPSIGPVAYTYVKDGSKVTTFVNGQKVEEIDSERAPRLAERLQLGKILLSCDSRNDLSGCQSNGQFRGVIAKVSIYDLPLSDKQLRRELIEQYNSWFGDSDFDADGITDTEELVGTLTKQGDILRTKFNEPDTDHDGLPDGFELGKSVDSSIEQTDVMRPASFVVSVDMPPAYNFTSYSSPTSRPDLADTDGDGIIDIEEYNLGTYVDGRDSDSDGIPDGLELSLETDPTNIDTDGDGLYDGVEYYSPLGVDPLVPDDLSIEFDLTDYATLFTYFGEKYSDSKTTLAEKAKLKALGVIIFPLKKLAEASGGTIALQSNQIINKNLEFYRYYESLQNSDKNKLFLESFGYRSQILPYGIFNISLGFVTGVELAEPKNSYQVAGQFLNVAAAFIPVADIPLAARDLTAQVIAGKEAEAALTALSVIPVAGAGADVTRAMTSASKIVKSTLKNKALIDSSAKNLAWLLQKLKVKDGFLASRAKELLALQIGGEIYLLLGESQPAYSSFSTQSVGALSSSSIRFTFDELLGIVRYTPADAIKKLANAVASNPNVEIRRISDSAIYGIESGIFKRTLENKHWQNGENHLVSVARAENLGANISSQSLFFARGTANFDDAATGMLDVRRADVAISNGVDANGVERFSLRESKVGYVAWSKRRIKSEVDRDCAMLNPIGSSPAAKVGTAKRAAVVDDVEWHFYASGETKSKVRLGMSGAVLEALKCNPSPPNKSIKIILNIAGNAVSGLSVKSFSSTVIEQAASNEESIISAGVSIGHRMMIIPSYASPENSLTWSEEAPGLTINVYYAEESFGPDGEYQNYALLQGGGVLLNQTSPVNMTGLESGKTYYLLVTAETENGEFLLSRELEITIAGGVTNYAHPLNDTGITWGGNYPYGNNITCTSNIDVPQDCNQGRDALAAAGSLNKVGGGNAGFDFTRINSDGSEYTGNGDYATAPWSCVRDNVTGLIWEVKAPSNGNVGDSLHDADDGYNWYNTDSTTNGGAVGYADNDGAICYGYNSANSTTYCNTEAFVNRVNAAGLCGATDWRLPKKGELRSIVDYGRYNPSIDTNYFPNTRNDRYWSGAPSAFGSNGSWIVYFAYGYVGIDDRYDGNHVRLVRSAP